MLSVDYCFFFIVFHLPFGVAALLPMPCCHCCCIIKKCKCISFITRDIMNLSIHIIYTTCLHCLPLAFSAHHLALTTCIRHPPPPPTIWLQCPPCPPPLLPTIQFGAHHLPPVLPLSSATNNHLRHPSFNSSTHHSTLPPTTSEADNQLILILGPY